MGVAWVGPELAPCCSAQGFRFRTRARSVRKVELRMPGDDTQSLIRRPYECRDSSFHVANAYVHVDRFTVAPVNAPDPACPPTAL